MINQPPLQDADQSLLSSTSSYSQIIPREQIIFPVRRDKPIIIKSIPINKQRLSTGLNHKQNSYKTLSQTNLFDSKNLSTKVQSLFHTEEFNSGIDFRSQSQRSIKLQENGLFDDQVIEKQQQKQQQQIVPQTAKKQNSPSQSLQKLPQIIQKQKYQSQNAILNYSMSSFASQKPLQMSPRQSFQWNSYKKQQKQQKQQKFNKIQSQKQQKLNNDIDTLVRKNQQLSTRLKQLQDTLKNESQNFDLQRKANQIYTEFYHTLSKIVSQFLKLNKSSIQLSQSQSLEPLNQSMNMEKITQTVTKLIQSFSTNSLIKTQQQTQQKFIQTECFPFQEIIGKENNQSQEAYIQKINYLQQLIEEVNEKNTKLKNQLLQSTQNNINAIFNTEISPSLCVQNEVKKINNQMVGLKDKLNLILLNQNNNNNNRHFYNQYPQFQPQIIYLPQQQQNVQPSPNNNDKKQVRKIVKIYTTKDKVYQSSQSNQDHEISSSSRNKKRQHSLSRHKHKRNASSKSEKSPSSSSMSSKSTKKREQMSRKQIQHLKQAYNQTKNQLNMLMNTFSKINSSQQEMRSYFRQIKEDFLKQLNAKLENVKRDNQKEKQFEKIQNQKIQFLARQQDRKQSDNKKLQSHFQQLLKQKQSSYQSQLDMIQKQRLHDQQIISSLNNKLLQLTARISVPQRVTQQLYTKKFSLQVIQQQLPTSDISVSVDWLKIIQQLKKQNHKQKQQIGSLLKSNDFLKSQIQHMTVIKSHESQRANRNNIYQYQQVSNNSYGRERKDSIINDLNGFSQASIYPTLPIRTNDNFQLKKNKLYHAQVRDSQQNLPYQQSNVVNHSINIKQSQVKNISNSISNVHFFQSQKNHESNIKAILHAKQTHIKSLQKEVLNLQQTVEYLKQQLSIRQRTIQELQNYIISLENQSAKSNSLLSPQQINTQPEINVYLGQNNVGLENVKNKYQNYVKNLKLLLKQTKNENKLLKQKITNLQKQPDQLTQSNVGLKNSAAHSQRTTKNFPNSSSPTHPKSQADILIRKRHQKHQIYQNQRQQQRINSLANQRELVN